MKKLTIITLIALSSCNAFKPLPLYTHTWNIEVTRLNNTIDTINHSIILPNPSAELDLPTKKNNNHCLYIALTLCDNTITCNVHKYKILQYNTTPNNP